MLDGGLWFSGTLQDHVGVWAPSLFTVTAWQMQGEVRLGMVDFMAWARLMGKTADSPQQVFTEAQQAVECMSAEKLAEYKGAGLGMTTFVAGPGSVWSVPPGYLVVVMAMNGQNAHSLQHWTVHPKQQQKEYYEFMLKSCLPASDEGKLMQKILAALTQPSQPSVAETRS